MIDSKRKIKDLCLKIFNYLQISNLLFYENMKFVYGCQYQYQSSCNISFTFRSNFIKFMF